MIANKQSPSSERLLSIIDLQNEIATCRMDVASVMQIVVDRAGVLTRALGTVVELVDGDEIVYRAASGTMRDHLGLRLARATSLSGRCVAERTSLLCHDTEVDTRVDLLACRRVGIRSMICVPLFHADDAVGVLKVTSQDVAAFGQEDLETLELLARIIGVSLYQAKVHESAVFQSLHDGLTGLWNRRAFDTRVNDEYERWRRYAHPLTLATFDLDRFKQLNDRFGHAAGDRALCTVARIFEKHSRTTDFAFRLGGDEFALLLPDTDKSGARVVISRMLDAVVAARLGDGLVSMSAGVAEPTRANALAFVVAADRALYAAKRHPQAQLSAPESL